MAVIKRASVKTGTMKLKRLKNDTGLGGGEYKYLLEYPDGDRVGPWTRKDAAIRKFNEEKRARSGDGSGGGMFGMFR